MFTGSLLTKIRKRSIFAFQLSGAVIQFRLLAIWLFEMQINDRSEAELHAYY